MRLEMNFDAWGGRRFLMVMGCGVVCTVLVWYGKISDEVFAATVLGTVGVYVGGNVYQRKVEGAQP
jgi:hypothetical protein